MRAIQRGTASAAFGNVAANHPKVYFVGTVHNGKEPVAVLANVATLGLPAIEDLKTAFETPNGRENLVIKEGVHTLSLEQLNSRMDSFDPKVYAKEIEQFKQAKHALEAKQPKAAAKAARHSASM